MLSRESIHVCPVLKEVVDNPVLAGSLFRRARDPSADALERRLPKASQRRGVHVSASLEELVDDKLVAAERCCLEGAQTPRLWQLWELGLHVVGIGIDLGTFIKQLLDEFGPSSCVNQH